MSVAARSVAVFGSAALLDPEHSVTPKELELLALYASGYSYDQIGAVKFFSPYTVRNKITASVKRSGCRNPTHLCAVLSARSMIKLGPKGIFEPVQDLRNASE